VQKALKHYIKFMNSVAKGTKWQRNEREWRSDKVWNVNSNTKYPMVYLLGEVRVLTN